MTSHSTTASEALDLLSLDGGIVLVAPLNWGLGHATRCIPLIRLLEKRCKKVIIASDGEALALLKKEFPHLAQETLPSYGIKYPTGNAILNILLCLPSMIPAAAGERKITQKLVQKYGITAIISDNRPGVYSAGIHNIYMTHQLRIQHHWRLVARVGSSIHRWLARRFDHWLIPDFEDSRALVPGLSGTNEPKAVYAGPLTRIHKESLPVSYDILVILSGPEPQRTVFEKGLIRILSAMAEYRILFVRGTTQAAAIDNASKHIRIVNFQDSREINHALNSSRLLISRSGYSTLMDIYDLPLKAILIPTPGQTEQEYIAGHLPADNRYTSLSQIELHKIPAVVSKMLVNEATN